MELKLTGIALNRLEKLTAHTGNNKGVKVSGPRTQGFQRMNVNIEYRISKWLLKEQQYSTCPKNTFVLITMTSSCTDVSFKLCYRLNHF